MLLDLTSEITLDHKNQKLYRALRLVLYIISASVATYLAIIILFPSLFFTFNFANPDAKSNSINDPRTELQIPIDHGMLSANQNYLFDTALTGVFSKAVVNFVLDKKSADPNPSTQIFVKKSYAAFLYPTGETLGFKDGTLLKNNSDYYIVSHSELRKFTSAKIVSALGFSPDAFLDISQEEMRYNPAGQPITTSADYPDFSLFKIAGDYYILQNKQLEKFSSPTAYHSHYHDTQAIAKNEDFLNTYPLSENQIGFDNGSLLSYGESAYIVSNKNISPVNNPVTFLSKGYLWNDIVPASSDEIAMYEKTKLFKINDPHPDGTIFKIIENNKYYLIKNKHKHLLPSEKIAESWLSHSPIEVSENKLNIMGSCNFKKDSFSSNSYSCEIPIGNLQDLVGSDYEFSLKPLENIQIDTINIEFKKDLNQKNLRTSLSELFNRVKNNYVPAATTP